MLSFFGLREDYIEHMFTLLAKLNLTSAFRYFMSVLLMIDGTDKFFNLVTYWPMYLWEGIPNITGLDASLILAILGVIEFLIGATLWLSLKWGGLLAGLLLFGIALNLLLAGKFLNIVLIDVALGMCCLALAQSDLPRPKDPQSTY